jgi:hypothetical protein
VLVDINTDPTAGNNSSDALFALNQFSTGYGNYTEDREARFKDLSLAELLQQMGGQQ